MKIIEKLTNSIILLPIDNFLYKEGHLVSLQDYGFTLSTNYKPFGIIEKIVNNICFIAYESMIFETSLFECSNYKINDFLYSNKIGELTNIKHTDDSILLGTIKNIKNNVLTVEWI